MRRLHSTSNLRRRLYEILERGSAGDRASLIFDRCIVTLIIVNLTAVTLESIPSLAASYGLWFDAIEYGSLVVFTVEYGLRLWAAVEPRDDAARDGIAPARKDDRYRPRFPLEGRGRRGDRRHPDRARLCSFSRNCPGCIGSSTRSKRVDHFLRVSREGLKDVPLLLFGG